MQFVDVWYAVLIIDRILNRDVFQEIDEHITSAAKIYIYISPNIIKSKIWWTWPSQEQYAGCLWFVDNCKYCRPISLHNVQKLA